MSLRIILAFQLFLDLTVPLLHIVVACTRFGDEPTSFTVLFTVILTIVAWSLTNGASWVLLLRQRRRGTVTQDADHGSSELDWPCLTCHILQLGPLWRFAKAFSASASNQFANLILLHLIPVFLLDLPLSVLDVHLMLTARKEFFLLTLSAGASIVSASLVLSSYREQIIRLTRKAKASSGEATDTSQDGPGYVDFPALGIFKQGPDNEHQSTCQGLTQEPPPYSKVGFQRVLSDSDSDCRKLNNLEDTSVSFQVDCKSGRGAADTKSASLDIEAKRQNNVRHWTRFVWMTSLLVSRVVSLASFAAVKPWIIFILLAAQWIVALAGLRIQNHVQRRGTDCRGRLRDIATSYAYLFCFLNLKPGHEVATSALYHTVILTENVGLVAVFLWNFDGDRAYTVAVTSVAFSSFFVAIFLIVVFYCLFSERAYLLIIEKCACCIWWNSERKRRAEAKVARKAARLEAKKVMTQSGTQINAMATHIITTLSLLPNSQEQQDGSSSKKTANPQQQITTGEPNAEGYVQDYRMRRSNKITIATLSQDIATPKGVSFQADAFSKFENPLTSTVQDSCAKTHSVKIHSSPTLTEMQISQEKTTITQQIQPPLPGNENKTRGILNPGFAADEPRPLCQVLSNFIEPGTERTRSDSQVMNDFRVNQIVCCPDKTDNFDEILLNENLDICTSWKR